MGLLILRSRTSAVLPHGQRGAALVVALILLVAITLLALASMNTASLDLVMAGNEQYRSDAFNAAEAGVEEANHNWDHFQTANAISSSGTTATGDSYSYTATPVGACAPPTGTSYGKYNGQYFNVVVNGTSPRGNATHTEGVVIPTMDDSFSENTCSAQNSSSASSGSSSSAGLY